MEHSTTPHIITLGTAGGPRVWLPSDDTEPRCGIATALVVGDSWYLIDCGQSAFRQIRKAGLNIDQLKGIFITHLHSDHTVDLLNVLTLGLYTMQETDRVIPIYGPGNRGILPPLSPRASGPVQPVFPDNPVPGTREMVEYLFRSHAADLNDRIIDSLRPDPTSIFVAHDIEIPAECGFHPNTNYSPTMDPFTVFEDDTVKVTATLVVHPPIAPAFAFRFDFAEGSVTISGDTAYSENLGTLAAGTDLLLHEAIDADWIYAFNDINTETGRAVIDHHFKSHTPPEEAGKLATEAGAKQLALHHLVPGSATAQVWDRARTTYSLKLHIPDDNQRIAVR